MIFVTGATGNIGKGVVKELINNNAEFVAGVRDGKQIENNDVTFLMRPFDYDDLNMMVDSLYAVNTLIFVSGNAETEQRIQQHRRVIDAAKSANVNHIVYLSFITVTDSQSKFSFTRQHVDTEQYLKQSGISHTIVRSSWYMDNIEFAVKDAVETGTFIDGSSKGKVSFISRSDISYGLAQLAMNKKKQGRTYTFTGDMAYAMKDIAHIISQHCGMRIDYKQISIDKYKSNLINDGLPTFLAEAIALNSYDIDAGDYAIVTSDAKEVNGRDTRRLEDYLTSICPIMCS